LFGYYVAPDAALRAGKVLRRAASIISAPGAWTANTATTRAADGTEVDPLAPEARSWCAAGAVARAEDELGGARWGCLPWVALTKHLGIDPQRHNNRKGRRAEQVVDALLGAAALVEQGANDLWHPWPPATAGGRRVKANYLHEIELHGVTVERRPRRRATPRVPLELTERVAA
jgi:hypothetical protein